MIFTAVLLVSGGLVAYATTTLFTQSFPSQTFVTQSKSGVSLFSQCNGITQSSKSNTSYAGSPAQILYGCYSFGNIIAAFYTNGTTSSSVMATPTFTEPTGWTLGLTDNGGCISTITLTSGAAISLSGGTNYLYCLTTSSASNFTSFSITWSQ